MADADALRDVGASGRPSSEPPAPGHGPATPADDPAVMTLVDHLSELRWRLFKSLLAVALGMTLGVALSEPAVALLSEPIPGGEPLFFTGLGDAFAIRLKIAFVIGVILAMPVLLYQGWAFIAPGLTAQERRAARPWIPLALFFFALGVSIAYIVLPFAASFLLGFTTPDLQPLITAGSYFEFVTTMFLAFGLVMEFPIVLYGLSRVGIATSERLAASRRYVILAIAIFAAVVTPGGDLVSPLTLGITMFVLFELTVFVIKRTGK
jgi:sec-independent protein translocase protein TatC